MKHIEVVAAVITKNKKIFCAQRNLLKSMGDKREFLGGKNRTRRNKQALIREIKEELDIDITVDSYVMTMEHSI